MFTRDGPAKIRQSKANLANTWAKLTGDKLVRSGLVKVKPVGTVNRPVVRPVSWPEMSPVAWLNVWPG